MKKWLTIGLIALSLLISGCQKKDAALSEMPLPPTDTTATVLVDTTTVTDSVQVK